MSEFFQPNFDAIVQRWPEIAERLSREDSAAVQAQLVQGLGTTLNINGIQLTSRHDRSSEALLQADSLPDKPLLHLYGTGLGDLPLQLLQRSSLSQLHVHILNGAVFALVLQLLEQSWLTDPRVQLHYAGDQPEIRLPFFALPAELLLADDYNAKIRDRLVSEIHLQFSNRDFDAQSPEIIERLQNTQPLVEKDADVAALFGSAAGREVFVIATGPSLEQHYPQLRNISQQAERPLFICVDTAYRPLREQGISVDIVVSIDQLISTRHLPAEGSEAFALVYLPMVDAQLLEAWRGSRYAAYSNSPVYHSMRKQLPRGELHTGGSVIHPAVDLAVKMGASQVTLFGADFAFPNDKTHTGWGDGDLGVSLLKAKHWVLDGQGQRVKTLLNFRSYLCELERFIAKHPQVRFYNSSRAGAMIDGTRFHPELTL